LRLGRLRALLIGVFQQSTCTDCIERAGTIRQTARVSLLQDDHAFELLEALIAESRADETEATLECVEERFVRFAPNGPTQSADRERYQLAVRVRYEQPGGGFREARATSGSLDRAEALATLLRASTLARLAAPSPEAQPLGGPVDVPGSAPERPTQDHSFREKAAWVERALARTEADGLLGAGLVSTLVANRTLVNSAGRRVHAARSRASFSLTACDGPGGRGGAGTAEQIDASVDRIDADAVITRAAETALRSRGPGELAPRDWTVVLAPRAVAGLLVSANFGAQEYAEGRSFLCGRVGERIFPDVLRITEEPGSRGATGWSFDGEGAPVQQVDLLRDGVLVGPVTDARWAARLGRPNTGHAVPQPSSTGPTAQHLTLASGGTSLDELVGGVEHGLLVSQLHYVNVSEPRDLVLTGTTRNGTFLIRDGRIVGGVNNLRFTESLVEALTRVTGVGSEAERVGALHEWECSVPALRIEGFRFTSAGSA
jgi:predicted Zn-dependent protease